jgi:hypothetical protein
MRIARAKCITSVGILILGSITTLAASTIAAHAQVDATLEFENQGEPQSAARTLVAHDPSIVLSQAPDGESPRSGDELPNGLTWAQLSPPSNVPAARSYPAMTYDPVSRKIILFGGSTASGYLNDTWTFDGAAWTKMIPAVSPPARNLAAMAFDSGSLQVVLFGGFNGQYLGDSWTWDGVASTWVKVISATLPKAVGGAMGFTDPINGHADIYGGFNGQFYYLDTYQWSGSAWNKLSPETSAWARSLAIAALNPRNSSVILFSGLGEIYTYNSWTWDGATWTEQFPGTQPPTRYGSGSAFDPLTGNVIIFGGGETNYDLNDTWMWTGANWAQLFPSRSPSSRKGFGMAYDPAINRVVLFGGVSRSGILFNDTWVFTAVLSSGEISDPQ